VPESLQALDRGAGYPAQSVKELVAQIKKGECILFLGAGIHVGPPEGSPYRYPEDHRPPQGQELVRRLLASCPVEPVGLQEDPRLQEALERFEAVRARLGVGDHSMTDAVTALEEAIQAIRESSRRNPTLDLQRVSLAIETTLGLGRKKLLDCLVAHLNVGKKPSPTLEMLAQLPFRIILTTNYDRMLETALQKCDKDPAVFVYSPHANELTPDMSEDPTAERPMVFKIHGDLNQRESIVITDEDYIAFVQRMSEKEVMHPVPGTIRFRMRKWPTLFVGYSLRDYNLRLLFRTLRWRVDPANFPPSFSVDRNPDPLILQVWQNERRFVSFVTQDLWTFIPWLSREVQGQEH
jgi:hypothetical protein